MFGNKEDNPMTFTNSNNDNETIIGKAVKIEGTLTAQENIKIEGIVEGKIKTEKNLYIGEGAIINADIVVNSAVIAGDLKGNIVAKNKLELKNTAKINGNVKAKIISIAEGAVLNGKCEMGENINITEIDKEKNAKNEKKAESK